MTDSSDSKQANDEGRVLLEELREFQRVREEEWAKTLAQLDRGERLINWMLLVLCTVLLVLSVVTRKFPVPLVCIIGALVARMLIDRSVQRRLAEVRRRRWR